jgi:hypothetical protein
MTRGHVSWSNFTDFIEGPCIICGNEVRYLLPADRPTPALLYHATCDPTPVLRQQLKAGPPPPLLPDAYTLKRQKPV